MLREVVTLSIKGKTFNFLLSCLFNLRHIVSIPQTNSRDWSCLIRRRGILLVLLCLNESCKNEKFIDQVKDLKSVSLKVSNNNVVQTSLEQNKSQINVYWDFCNNKLLKRYRV